MTRILVCGGRTYDDQAAIHRCLDIIHAAKNITLLIHGGSRGADTIAEEWAVTNGVPTSAYVHSNI